MPTSRPLAALTALVLLTACGGGETSGEGDTAPPPPPTTAAGQPTDAQATEDQAAGGTPTEVELVDFAIEAPASAPPGEFVVRNGGAAPHTFTATDGSWDTGIVQPQGETTITIDDAGTVDYVCSLHPDRMSGTIEIG